MQIIRWQIPVAMLARYSYTRRRHVMRSTRAAYAGPMFHLTSGASMLGAFFIATDPVSAATSDRGRLIYGAGIGLLTYVIRTWGGYPDGVAFAVLLMNLAVPLIDRYTVPRIYGRARLTPRDRRSRWHIVGRPIVTAVVRHLRRELTRERIARQRAGMDQAATRYSRCARHARQRSR